ncbi:MAG: sensor histidine kinase, partial [Acidimicrobiia bacterium]
MSDRTLVLIGRLLAGAAFGMAALSLTMYLASGNSDRLFGDWALHNIFGAILLALLGLLAIPRAPRNGSLWALTGSGVFSGLQSLGAAIGLVVGSTSNADAQAGLVDVAPADLEFIGALGLNVAMSSWVAGGALLGLGILLLPDGLLPRPARLWRWVPVALVGGGLTAFILFGCSTRPSSTIPYSEMTRVFGVPSAAPAVGRAALVAAAVGLMGAFAAVLVKWRQANDFEERLRYRWIGWASVVFGVAFAAVLIDVQLWQWTELIASPVFAVAFFVSITKYRLYDIDVVISRSIVFGLLAVFITVVYAVVVGTLGSVIGGSGVVLAIAATTIVAIAFEPVRTAAQRLANRLVYGRRAAPYEVLSDLTRSLPNAEEEAGLLDRMATQLRAGTGADRAQVWLATNNGLTLAASDPTAPNATVSRIEDLNGVAVPIEHDGGTLGALTVEPAAGASLRPAELRLAHDLAGSAALVVTKLRLDTDLEHTAAQLATSRRRLVDAQDTELRRLERQLQEGAIQDILGLKVAITLAARTAHDEGTTRTADLLTGLANETQGAIDEIHSLATGLYPALLETEGLEPAIRAMATTAPIPITVTGTTPRLHRDTEIAAFYTITEATTNAIKHAHPPITITLTHTESTLTFTITDTGPGFDSTTTHHGSGLLNMTDRIDTIGGTLTIKSANGTPTTITATIPAYNAEPTKGALDWDQESARSSDSGPNSDFEMNATAPASSAE